MTTTRQPTAEQIAALEAFAAAHGRRWKATLSEIYWFNARLWRGADGKDEIVGSVLHGIRNEFGPTWLDMFKLPKKGA